MRRGFFVTGTDTGVGKTLACCALLHAFRDAGQGAYPVKPVAAGAVPVDGAWRNEDTLALARAAGDRAPPLDDITPLLLREALAPHIAAAREGRTIGLAPVAAAWARLAGREGWALVEGVGGFRVPLAPALDTVDLARLFGLPVVMVVGLRLGCLNHALLTAAAIEASGLPLAGWIANGIDPAMAAPDENVAALRERIAAPLVGRLPFDSRAGTDPALLARHLDVACLVAAPS